MPPGKEITRLLADWRHGDPLALDALVPLVYDELRRLADGYMRRERPDHTLQATALVHEAYLRLVGMDVPWESRLHFFAVAAQVMRRILVDHARQYQYAKRGSGARKLSLDEAVDFSIERAADAVALDDALSSLSSPQSIEKRNRHDRTDRGDPPWSPATKAWLRPSREATEGLPYRMN